MAESLVQQIQSLDQRAVGFIESLDRFIGKHIGSSGGPQAAPPGGEVPTTNELIQRCHQRFNKISELLERLHNEF